MGEDLGLFLNIQTPREVFEFASGEFRNSWDVVLCLWSWIFLSIGFCSVFFPDVELIFKEIGHRRLKGVYKRSLIHFVKRKKERDNNNNGHNNQGCNEWQETIKDI